jgi:hypothetical protein
MVDKPCVIALLDTVKTGKFNRDVEMLHQVYLIHKQSSVLTSKIGISLGYGLMEDATRKYYLTLRQIPTI